MTLRSDGRRADELRNVAFTLDFQSHPAGSVLVAMGGTRVSCSVSVQAGVPRWMRDEQRPGGWITSEYQMLSGATSPRTQSASSRGRPDGRSSEIQRLVGRSLRAAVDLALLPASTFYIDCDVIDADGGTRCAAITGGCLALELALTRMFQDGALKKWPVRKGLAAVSVGIVDGEPLLDLAYEEDVAADVDMNVVMTGEGNFIEVQGTAEGQAFPRSALDKLLGLAEKGISELVVLQKAALKGGLGS